MEDLENLDITVFHDGGIHGSFEIEIDGDRWIHYHIFIGVHPSPFLMPSECPLCNCSDDDDDDNENLKIFLFAGVVPITSILVIVTILLILTIICCVCCPFYKKFQKGEEDSLKNSYNGNYLKEGNEIKRLKKEVT